MLPQLSLRTAVRADGSYSDRAGRVLRLMKEFQYIDSLEEVSSFQQSIAAANVVAMDTEFVREKTYFPIGCLIQFSIVTSGQSEAQPDVNNFVIDILDPTIAQAVLHALQSFNGPIVMHSARQDLEVLAKIESPPLRTLFDTQIAASLLGFPEQMGYSKLVSQLLDVELAKDATRTDWSKRPLSSRQLRYAVDDTYYLALLYPRLCDRLEVQGRLSWATEDSQNLLEHFDLDALYSPRRAIEKIKGANRVPATVFRRLDKLALWREQVAQARDVPRRWIADDKRMREWAKSDEASMAERIASELDLNEKETAELRHLFDDVDTSDEYVSGMPPQEITPDEKLKVKALAELVERHAQTLGIEPSVIASRRDLEAAVRGHWDVAPFHGWRGQVIGNELRDALA